MNSEFMICSIFLSVILFLWPLKTIYRFIRASSFYFKIFKRVSSEKLTNTLKFFFLQSFTWHLCLLWFIWLILGLYSYNFEKSDPLFIGGNNFLWLWLQGDKVLSTTDFVNSNLFWSFKFSWFKDSLYSLLLCLYGTFSSEGFIWYFTTDYTTFCS